MAVEKTKAEERSLFRFLHTQTFVRVDVAGAV